MRSSRQENVLVTLLRQCYLTPTCRAQARNVRSRARTHARSFQTETSSRLKSIESRKGQFGGPIELLGAHGTEEQLLKSRLSSKSSTSGSGGPTLYEPPKDVAILGGGITGLASAFYLSKELPNTHITIYEGSDRLGGWLQTKHVNVANGEMVFEQGPRTLRPNTAAGMVTLNMIKLLGLEDELLITSKSSIAAQNRFIYYPDHLVRMPGPGADFFEQLWRLITEPVFKGFVSALWSENNIPKRPDTLEDESVGSFLSRRLGSSKIPDNIVSAVLHGIYAGDIYQLSIKSLQPALWHSEGQHGSLLNGFMANRSQKGTTIQWRDGALMQEMTSKPNSLARSSEMDFASVYSFKKGIGQLSDKLSSSLTENKNIKIKTNHSVQSVVYDPRVDKVKVTTKDQTAKLHDRVISTISGRKLSSLVPTNAALPSLAATHSVTVMVVNLYYSDSNILSEHGFGYLIPRSIPYEQNPEMALGVVFDSDASIGQDTASGTKLTVMMGGHWWDDFTSYPDEEEGARMAKAVLRRHLKIDVEPEYVHATLQKECIPQYTVGHESRMKKAHQELMTAFKGKLSVAGNSFTGVGLNDCVRSARDLALDVAGFEGPGGVTGLEQFLTERRWVKAIMGSA